jgi:glycosyltransferase involved in cell wall biosynthesis
MGTADYKNPLASLKAFAQLSNTGAKLYITGPATAELTSFSDSLSPDVRCRVSMGRFLSAEELRGLLESARIVSVPSYYSVPVASPTVLESFAAETPVVCSCSISRDIIRDGGNGIIADNPGAIAIAFDRLLRENDTWQTLSDGARDTIKTFSAETVAMQYEKLASQ